MSGRGRAVQLPIYHARPMVPPSIVSGAVPVAHGLYRENVVKVWANVSVTPGLNDSFNMTSVADGGAGLVTVTFDRDFANTTYAIVGAGNNGSDTVVSFNSLAAGSATAQLINSDAAGRADAAFTFLAIGDQ